MSDLLEDVVENEYSGKDEDFEYIKLAKQGDTPALNYILNKYDVMVKSKAKPFFLMGADREDLIQEGMIGLYKAVRDYDEQKTCTFKRFAEVCVTRQLITAVKTANRQKHRPLNTYVSLNKPIFDDEPENTLIDLIRANVLTDPEELILSKEQYESIERKLKEKLSPFEKEVMNIYITGKSYSAVARELDKDPKSVDNAIQRVKKKLEKILESEGY